MSDAGTPNTPLAVVLLSGGMDSCVTLAHAIERGFGIAALHVNYGQRTQQRELQAFTDICEYYGISRTLVVNISHLAQIGGSALTDTGIDFPPGDPESARIPVTYVPFRNANILAIAVSWAEVLGADAIFIGAVEEDSSGYPDCREVFFRAFEQVIATGSATGSTISIHTPLLHRTKADIVTMGIGLSAPLHLTWSCYQNNTYACGTCDSCMLRLKGFAAAGMTDSIVYQP